ncbi:hypothetical protein GASC598I20_008680, partial [Gilliamella apicola SCGC AB-598-I20]
IIDKNSGKTKPQDVKTLMNMTRELL